MDISRLAHASVVVALALACAIWLSADAGPDRRPLVIYVGHGTAEEDDSWQHFRAAVQLTHPRLLSEAHIEFTGTSDHDEVARRDRLRAVGARAPALVIASNGSSALAMRMVSPATPVIFTSYDDPMEQNIVSALGPRPEPITGISLFDALDGKRLQLLHEAYPALRTVAVLADAAWAGSGGAERVRAAGAHAGLKVTVLLAESPADVRAVFALPEARAYDAWYLPASWVEYRTFPFVIDRMRTWHRPCIFATIEAVQQGGLMAYIQDTDFVWPALADLVARVLAGEATGDIPVMRPQRFTLAVRARPDTGVALPELPVMRRADVVLR